MTLLTVLPGGGGELSASALFHDWHWQASCQWHPDGEFLKLLLLAVSWQ